MPVYPSEMQLFYSGEWVNRVKSRCHPSIVGELKGLLHRDLLKQNDCIYEKVPDGLVNYLFCISYIHSAVSFSMTASQFSV